ncbi:hypothetical protein GCM10011515_10500 [Tsuneonella deserti]|uniref:Tetratricopeptide repeat protein n=1 Tax=Tsuneonella deserti TaxID=2035528 RepID=A0ABQ1S6R9_9SPHN|nr:hypothetical protein [Tsuneonella deserti]GGD92673.1 hypothetical protein GCM10011515_10500 [Tsuneonella deserti]
MSFIRRPGAASRMALAIALSSGIALTAAAPAQAAKKQVQPAAPKSNYSKGFVGVYQPFAVKLKAGGDLTPLKAELAAVQAAASTPDDKFAAGQVTYSLGAQTKDLALQRQGINMMIDSNSPLGAADRPSHLFAASQLAYQDKDWATARARAEQALAAGYTGDAELIIAETYFAQDQDAAGVESLDKVIAKKVAAGETPPETWVKRGLAAAYTAKMEPQAAKYAAMYAQYYPSKDSWGDAIAIQRNLNNYDGQDLLDLMRLAERTGSLRNERDYVDYISAADARRLPGETQRIIKAGIAAGLLKSGDVFVTEANSISSARLQADTADLPKLATDARSAGASVATLMAAGDAFLSYRKPAEAEEFYARALTKPGVDTPRVLTRLGIAQADQGKSAEAVATFAKVEGARQAIARLWAVYAQQAGKTAAPAAQ